MTSYPASSDPRRAGAIQQADLVSSASLSLRQNPDSFLSPQQLAVLRSYEEDSLRFVLRDMPPHNVGAATSLGRPAPAYPPPAYRLQDSSHVLHPQQQLALALLAAQEQSGLAQPPSLSVTAPAAASDLLRQAEYAEQHLLRAELAALAQQQQQQQQRGLATAATAVSDASLEDLMVAAWGSQLEQQLNLHQLSRQLPPTEPPPPFPPPPPHCSSFANRPTGMPVAGGNHLALLPRNVSLPAALRDTVARGQESSPWAPTALHMNEGLSSQKPLKKRKVTVRRKRSQENFPTRLMRALIGHEQELEKSDRKPECFEWLRNASVLMVVDRDGFVAMLKQVGLLNSKATYSSLTRKMHRWGFVRKSSADGHCFGHQNFQKGRLDLTMQMESSWFQDHLHS